MFDMVKFIECVHKRQSLWDKNSKGYSDKVYRDHLWNEIGEIMYETWTQMDQRDRDDKTKELKEKWRNTRDTYVKYINTEKSTDPSIKKRRRYVYADSLTFIQTPTEKRKSESVDDPEEVEGIELNEGDVDEGITATVDWEVGCHFLEFDDETEGKTPESSVDQSVNTSLNQSATTSSVDSNLSGFTMFDNDKFITCIHERPCLWEKQMKEYSDKCLRDKSWNEIGIIMYENWITLEPSWKDAKVREMKDKWKNLRDAYVKYVNQLKSGNFALRKRKKYVYADALKFLQSDLEKRKSSGNSEDFEEPESSKKELKDLLEPQDTLIDRIPDSKPIKVSHNGIVPSASPRVSSNSTGAKLSHFQKELLKKLEETSDKEEDPDRLFLVSLLPDFKKLNDDEKLDFKFMVLQYFRDFRRKQYFQPQNIPQTSSQLSFHPSQMAPNYPS